MIKVTCKKSKFVSVILMLALIATLISVSGSTVFADGTVTVDNPDTSIIYNGAWTQGTDPLDYNGTEAFSNTTNGYAQLTFTGTSVSWISPKGNNMGKADVYIDGTIAQSGIDCYAVGKTYQQTLFTCTGLSNTTHTIKVVITGTKNASSSNTYLVVDSFTYYGTGGGDTPTPTPVITPTPTPPSGSGTVDDPDASITYSGSWTHGNEPLDYNGTETFCNTTDAYAQFTFTGTSISWISAKNNNLGKADIYIDGTIVQSGIDCYAAGKVYQQVLFSRTDLASGSHTIKVVVTGTKNASSSNTYLIIDAFQTSGSGSTPAPDPTATPVPTPTPTGTLAPTPTPPGGTYAYGKVTPVSPAYGANINGDTVIQFYAPGCSTAAAICRHQPDADHPDPAGYAAWFSTGPGGGYGSTTLDANGYGTATLHASDYPHGPICIEIVAWYSGGGAAADTAYLQLYNTGGVMWNQGLSSAPTPPQAAGMSLIYQDDFTDMPTIDRLNSSSAKYYSAKPDVSGGSEFGMAVFADNNGPYNPFSQTESYMRIRCQQQGPGFVDPYNWGRTCTGGMLSSMRPDGTGIYAKYGYFEARIRMPAATGTWPAFWLMTNGNCPGRGSTTSDELDINESYGLSAGFQMARHTWGYGTTHEAHWVNGYDVGLDFLVYGCKVTPTDTIMYVNNTEVWRFPTSDVAKNEPMYFMINNALQVADIDLSRNGGHVDLWVDWVRVFQ